MFSRYIHSFSLWFSSIWYDMPWCVGFLFVYVLDLTWYYPAWYSVCQFLESVNWCLSLAFNIFHSLFLLPYSCFSFWVSNYVHLILSHKSWFLYSFFFSCFFYLHFSVFRLVALFFSLLSLSLTVLILLRSMAKTVFISTVFVLFLKCPFDSFLYFLFPYWN